MLTVVKSLNNNIILAVTEMDQELVAFGTGIGFKRKKGDRVSIEEASKIGSLSNGVDGIISLE